MKTKLLTLIFSSLLPLAAAANSGVEKAVDVSIPFANQAQQIRSDLAGDAYSEISQEDRQKVDAALARLEVVLGSGTDIKQLEDADKVQLFNDQEVVNTVLMKARADSRVICKREKTVGSHRAASQCLTVAERRKLRADSFELLQANQRYFPAKEKTP